MKHLITTALIATSALVAQAEETVTEKARAAAHAVVHETKEAARDTKDFVVDTTRSAARRTRESWHKTVAYVSDDLPVYRGGASQTLDTLGKEIAELKALVPMPEPAYFRTRVVSLEQQHAFLSKRLALLSQGQLVERNSGPRYEFDQLVVDLEQALDQARAGADIITRNMPR